MITKKTEFYPAKVGQISCVGIRLKDYPLSFGNYFWLYDGPRIINMWGENLKEAARRFNMESVECTVLSDGKHELAFITDKRIPKDWLYNKLCITGCGWGSRELCEACLDFAGIEKNWNYCGCEKPEEAPRISHMFTFGKREDTFHCHRCNRKETISYE